MEFIRLSLFPLLFLIYTGSEEDKRLNKRIKRVGKTSERK